MSTRGRRSSPETERSQAAGPWRWRVESLALSVVLVAGIIAGGAAAGVGPAGVVMADHGDDEDFLPPEVTNVTRTGTTTVEVYMSDNHDVDEESISNDDFNVSSGNISSVEVSEKGTDAIININLSDVDNEAVIISTNDSHDGNDSGIRDTNGNEFDPVDEFSEIVPANDRAPRLQSATRINVSTVEVTLVDEDGIDEETVDADDFMLNRTAPEEFDSKRSVANESSIENVTVESEGTDAIVTLSLDSGIGRKPLLVGLSDDVQFIDENGTGDPADIADMNGTVVEPPFRDVRVRGVSGPELYNVSKLSDTEIKAYFVDDRDVAETSFQTADFQVAKSRVEERPLTEMIEGNDFENASLFDLRLADVRTTEDGSNATVVLELVRPVDVDELLVRVRDDAIVTDTQRHEMNLTDEDTNSWEIIDGMDGVTPEVDRFAVTETTSDGVELSVTASEPLAGLGLSVGGEVSDRLDRSDFTVNGSTNEYSTTYTPDVEGTVTFRLEDVTDRAGNTNTVDLVRTSGVDRSGPDPVIAIDFAASENLTLVFDGSHTTDMTGVASYTWAFEDGTNATGERTTKTFDPGTHTVSLTATDPQGHNGTTTATLDLDSGAGDIGSGSVAALDGVRRATDPAVSVVQSGEGPAGTALLEIREPSPGVPVSAAGGPGEGLARNGDLVIEDIEIVPARYREFTLGVSASGPQSVSGAATATDTRPVGGFSVAHDVPDSGFESVTILASVDDARLAEMDADPEDLTVLRQTDEEWQSLETTPVSGEADTDGRTRIRAESPGLSRFAVAVEGVPATEDQAESPTPTGTASDDSETTPTPTPASSPENASVVVTNATLSEESVDPGTTVLVNATLENRADGNSVYLAGLSANGTVVATESVTLPAGQEGAVSFEYVPEEPGTYPVAVNGTTAGELTVGGGGLLSSVLGVFDPILGVLGSVFGFLPLGLVRPAAIFVGLPALVIFLLLKGLAIYMGY